MTAADDVVQEIANLARAFASIEIPEAHLAHWTEDRDWNVFQAGVHFGQAATIYVLQRHGLLPTQPEDHQ
jgi:hypothetical protein